MAEMQALFTLGTQTRPKGMRQHHRHAGLVGVAPVQPLKGDRDGSGVGGGGQASAPTCV